jgi:hypothetical protein
MRLKPAANFCLVPRRFAQLSVCQRVDGFAGAPVVLGAVGLRGWAFELCLASCHSAVNNKAITVSVAAAPSIHAKGRRSRCATALSWASISRSKARSRSLWVIRVPPFSCAQRHRKLWVPRRARRVPDTSSKSEVYKSVRTAGGAGHKRYLFSISSPDACEQKSPSATLGLFFQIGPAFRSQARSAMRAEPDASGIECHRAQSPRTATRPGRG